MNIVLGIFLILGAVVLWFAAELVRLQHRSWGFFRSDWMMVVFYFSVLLIALFMMVYALWLFNAYQPWLQDFLGRVFKDKT